MALALESLVFDVNTEKLLAAKKAIDDLSSSMNNLNKVQEQSEGTSKKAKKAKDDITKSSEDASRAVEETNVKLSAAEKINERVAAKTELLRSGILNLKDAALDLGKGFTTSQANLLASLSTMGAASDLIKNVAKNFKDFNAFSSAKPFDPTVAGLEKLQKDTKELVLVNEYMARGLGLTREQVMGLARDSEALRQQFSQAGKSETELATALTKLEKDTVQAANGLNSLIAAGKEADSIAKKHAESEAKRVAIMREYGSKTNREDAMYSQSMQAQREYYIGLEQEAAKRQKIREEESRVFNLIANAKQEQEAREYSEAQSRLREHYSELERISLLGEKQLQQVQDKINKETGINKYTSQGISRTYAGTAYEMEKAGVDESVIKSYIESAHAQELSARAARERLNAQRAVEAQEERLFSTVGHLNDGISHNSKLNERAALALGSYERNLRLAGISGEEAAKKLQAFKAAQEQVSAAEGKNRASYISRGIGVQMGDVAVSLASGMNPLTVAIQQGDQIRGLIQQSGLEATQMSGIMQQAFGGIVTSFKDVGVAMGAFVLGGFKTLGENIVSLAGKITLLNGVVDSFKTKTLDVGPPTRTMSTAIKAMEAAFTVASIAAGLGTVALGVFAVSSLAATKEQYKLNQVLTLQGAAMGVNTNAAYAQANAMQALGIKQTDTINVISEMAKAGNLSRNSIEMITTAAVKLKDSGGVAIEETVKNFSDLGKEPVKAVVSLNEKYNFLTSSVYLQIKALEEQGNTAEAAKVAQQAYADMIDSRVKTMDSNIGILAKAWKSLGQAASSAWDSMLNIGRDNPEEKLQQALATMQGKSYLEGGLAFGGKEEALAYIRVYEAKAEAIKKETDAKLRDKEATDGTIELSKLSSEYADKQTKKQLELNKLNAAYTKALIGTNGDSKLQLEIAKQYEATLAGINDKYKEKNTKDTVRTATENYFSTALEKISDLNIKNTKTTEASTKAGQLLLDLQSNSKWDSTLNKRINLWDTLSAKNKKYIEDEIDKAKAIELQNQAYDSQARQVKELETLRSKYSTDESKQLLEINSRNQNIGLTEEQRLVNAELLKIDQYRIDALHKINELVAKEKEKNPNLDETEYRTQAEKDLTEAIARRKELATNAVKESQNQATSFESGWKNAFASYLDSANNAATTAQTLFQKMTDGMTDAIVQFATTGKLSFSDFANSIIKEMLAISAKRAALGLTGLLGGLVIGTSPALASSGYDQVGKASMAFSDASAMWNANGNAFNPSGIVHAFANGGTFTNSIVNSATPFMFANGGSFGVMGEAGPEAVMPLQRTSNGKLGVISTGGNSSPVNVEVNVSIASDGSATTTSNSEVAGKNLGNLIAAAVTSAIIKEKRNGGLLSSNK